MKPTVVDVVNKLVALGSADQIALFFEGEEIVGEPTFTDACPVANYVRRETGRRVLASWSGIYAFGHADRLEVEFGFEPIGAFMRKFDSLSYPALIDKESAWS